jgi:hypothetical protein
VLRLGTLFLVALELYKHEVNHISYLASNSQIMNSFLDPVN